MDNITTYTKIVDDGGIYSLSALLLDDGTYTVPFIEFGDEVDEPYDNVAWVVAPLLTFLFLGQEPHKSVDEIFKLEKKNFKQIFEKGIRLKFFGQEVFDEYEKHFPKRETF